MAIPFPVHPVTVGPIVGATTDTTVRLWGRGEPPRLPGGRYCYGVAQLLTAGSTVPALGAYFRMRAEDDFTGSVDLAGLEPARAYAYRLGYFFSDVEQHLLMPAVGLDLQGATAGAFRTARPPGTPELSFVFGSCRHPGPSEDEIVGLGNRGDTVFGTILEQVERRPTDLLLMVGDQIYADVRRDVRTFEEYCATYREAFTQPNLQKLMARVPTYMVLDDHEIADNWSMDKLVDPKLSNEERWANRVRFLAAMEAYRAYQVVHGPALERRDVPNLTNTLTRYWYDFEVGPARFFVLDTRTERYHRARPPQIMGPPQQDALKHWLTKEPGRLKFVVSSVPLFPDVKLAGLMSAEREDKWAGFLLQRQQLLDFIRDNDVRRVVFLSGDIHASLWSELRSTSRPDFRLYSVISSAFAAPAFVPPEFMYEQAGILDGQSDYVVTKHGGYVQLSNFTRLTWTEPVLRVDVYERKGALLQSAELRLDA